MLSKNQIKYINSLSIKKYRQQHKSFLVEGAKSVVELLDSDFTVELLIATAEFQQKYGSILSKYDVALESVTPDELSRLGSFQTNDSCLAIAKTKENQILHVTDGEYALVLDDVRDPGNLGTLLRIADWYGINKVICSENTTDLYNSKVIAASKGSFTRVKTYYTSLEDFFNGYTKPLNVLGTFLNGTSIYDVTFEKKGGYIILGNEANGISDKIGSYVTQRVTIPRFGGAESLNVGIAAAVLCDNMRRQLGA
jgi:TrmH family RNA methyltransferase